MNENKSPERPSRDPDIVLPDTDHYHEVEIWVEESVFCISGYMSKSVSVSSADICNVESATEYMNSLVNFSNESLDKEDKTRVQPILDYYAEQAIFGED
jgi:hypothetical protein